MSKGNRKRKTGPVSAILDATSKALKVAKKAVKGVNKLTGLNLKNKMKKGKTPEGRARQKARRKNRVGMTNSSSDGINRQAIMSNMSQLSDTFNWRCEKVADIVGNNTTSVAVTSYFINPGNATLFPIFSQIAQTYQQWELIGDMEFIFLTESYAASGSNITAGKVIMATNYDSDEVNFSSTSAMENQYGCVSGPPYAEKLVHRVTMKASGAGGKDAPLGTYYVNYSNNNSSPSGQYTGGHFYDIGNFQIGVVNTAASSSQIIGELYVRYRFKLIKPAEPPAGNIQDYSHASGGLSTAALPFHSVVYGVGSSFSCCGLSSTGTAPNSNYITLPYTGNYFVSCQWKSAGGTIGAAPILGTASNINLLTIFNAGSSNTISEYDYHANAWATLNFVASVTQEGVGSANHMVVSGLTGMSDGVVDVFACSIPYESLTSVRPVVTNKKFDGEMEKMRKVIEDMKLRIAALDKDPTYMVVDEKDDDTVSIVSSSSRCNNREVRKVSQK